MLRLPATRRQDFFWSFLSTTVSPVLRKVPSAKKATIFVVLSCVLLFVTP